MNHPTLRIAKLASLLVAAALVAPAVAQAQSPGRIPERTASDSTPPAMDDFAAFLAADYYDNNSSIADNTKVIKSLKGLLGRSHVNSTTRFKLERRLADAYRVKAEAEGRQALTRYREAYRAWQTAGEIGEAPRYAPGAASADLLKSVATYRQYFSDYAKADGMPAQRLALALLLGRLGDENAELYLRDLIKSDAPAKVVQVAKLGLAELLFAKGQPAAAAPLLADVGGKGAEVLRPWARYRLGWMLSLTAGDAGAAKAVELWMPLARAAAHGKDAGDEYTLAAAARQDLVALWARTGQDKAAVAFFTQLKDPENAGNTLARIGYRAAAAGQPAAAILAYEALRQAFPKRPGMCVTDLRLTGLYDGQKDYPHAAGSLAAMISSCQSNGGTESPAHALLGRTLVAYGTNYYQQGIKESDKLRLQAANVAFRGFLAGFAAQSNANDVRFALADVLERLGDKAQAAREYFLVARVDAAGAPLRHNAALRMLALQKDVAAAAPAAPAVAPGALAQPVPLPPAKAFLVEVIDAFRKYVPDAPTGPAEALTAAMLEFDYGHYATALPRLGTVVAIAPRGPEADSAARTALAFYQGRKDWDHMISASQSYLKHDLAEPLALAVTASLRTGMWERAAGLERAGKGLDATTAYLAFQGRFPLDRDADLALRQAMNLQRQGGHAAPCLKSAQQIYADYRASAYRPEALRTAGDINEQRAEFEAAALDFLALATDYPRDAKAPEALARVGELYTAAENNSAAAAALEQLASTYRDSPLAPAALLKSAKLHDEQNDAPQAIADYAEYSRRAGSTSPEQALFAQVRATVLRTALGGTAAATEAAQAIPRLEATVVALPPGQAVLARNELARYRLDGANEGLEQLSERDLATSSLVEFKASCDELVKTVGLREAKLAAVERLRSPLYGGAAAFARGELNEIAASRLRLAQFSNALEAAEAYEMGKIKERLLLTYQRTMLASYKAAATVGAVPAAWRIQAQAKLSHVDPAHYAGANERLMSPTFIDHVVALPSGAAD